MRFAVFTAATPDWAPAEAARRIAAAGYDGIEWRVVDQPGTGPVSFWANNRATWPASGWREHVAAMREAASGVGLTMPALGSYAGHDDPAGVEQMCALAGELGVSQLRVCVAGLGERGVPPYVEVFERARRELRALDPVLDAHGVRGLVELHFGTVAASASAALRLLDGLDPARWGVIHDLGNLVVEGYEDVWAGVSMLGPYLAHAHVKNARWVPDGDGWRWEFAGLREGQADVASWLAALASVGYDAWITVEDFSPTPDRGALLGDNLAHLRALWDATAPTPRPGEDLP